MNKKGFTLAEVLVTLGAVGVIAAITAPMLSSLMPDEHKTKVLKYYKTVQDINQALLNDPFYYYDYTEINNETRYIKLGLSSFGNKSRFSGLAENVTDYEYNTKYKGSQKYCYLLADKLELKPGTNVTKSGIRYYNFELIDGTTVACQDLYTSSPTSPGGDNYVEGASYTLTFDTNGTDGPGKKGSSTQKKPDQFIFNVDNYGKVTADSNDRLTGQYLKNPHKLNDKKADYKAAFDS